jgi:DNA-binding transcriptional LysR family regulator
MTQREPSWELLRTFLEVARDGSLSGAARRLGLTQPTAGRHINVLEADLGVALFTRSQRGLLATPAALELVPHAEAMEAASAALQRRASGEAAAEGGTVRITASEIVGCEVLPPILAAFRHAHPGIVLELSLSNRNEDLLRRDADIAVRMVRPVQASLTAKRLGSVEVRLYAHKDYVARFGLPQSLPDLAGHCLIGFDRDDHALRSLGPKAAPITRESFGFRTDNDSAQLAALRAGVGIGGCQSLLAARMPPLVPVLHDIIAFPLEMWLVMHEDLKATRRVRLLFDHLGLGLAGYLRGPRGTSGPKKRHAGALSSG